MQNVSMYGRGTDNNIIVTDDGKKYKKSSKAKNIAGITAAEIAGSAAMFGVQRFAGIPISKVLKNIELENDAFQKAVPEAFKKSGLAEKGVQFINASNNEKAVEDALKENLPKWMKKLPPKVQEVVIQRPKNSTLEGQNAFFAPKGNKILVNTDKAAVFSFHEMGHAMNKNMGGLGKILMTSRRVLPLLSAFAVYTAIFKRPKAEGEQPKGFWDKLTTFVKNNAGKLAFAGMMPVVLEEGLASIKGAKLAKEFLNPAQYKRLNITNAKALLTYMGLAVGMGVGTYIVSKVKDAITKPKEIK